MRKYSFFILIFSVLLVNAQSKLKPGFHKDEYIETLRMASSFADDDYSRTTKIESPANFEHKYRSPIVGLENCWDLWISGDSVAAISIRGSVPKALSWSANYYAGMVPASGVMVVGDSVEYKLTDNKAAAVHTGWLAASLFLYKDMKPRIDSLYRAGIRDFIVAGHSQGGAICYIMTALLRQLQIDGKLPADIQFKSYASAAPKPGNTQFAYEYENMTRGGWAYNVISAIDWVPETPLSVQTLNDFVPNSPFSEAEKMIKEQKMGDRIKYRFLYSQLKNPTNRSNRRLKKYLGKSVGKMVENEVEGFKQPKYFDSACYMRTGTIVVLIPNEDYYGKFSAISEDKFIHHMYNAYRFLIDKY